MKFGFVTEACCFSESSCACRSDGQSVQVHESLARQLAARVAPGHRVGHGDLPLAAPLENHFLAQGNEQLINAGESADLAVLVDVHPGVVEAQSELRPFSFRLLQAAPDRFEILAGGGDGFLDAPGTGLVVVVGHHAHVQLPQSRVALNQRVRAAATVRVQIENQDVPASRLRQRVCGNGQTVQRAEARPSVALGMVKAAGEGAGHAIPHGSFARVHHAAADVQGHRQNPCIPIELGGGGGFAWLAAAERFEVGRRVDAQHLGLRDRAGRQETNIWDGLFCQRVHNPRRLARGVEAVLGEDKLVTVVERGRSHCRSL